MTVNRPQDVIPGSGRQGTARSLVTAPGYLVREAGPADWDDLAALRYAVEEHLADCGLDQWADSTRGLEQLSSRLSRREMYVLASATTPPRLAGAFALTGRWDSDFWAGDPERDDFLYLHKVMTAPAFRRQGVGAFIVSLGLDAARTWGRAGLRLESWKGNPGLQATWERLGFRYLRTVDAPGRKAGVLMELRDDPASRDGLMACPCGRGDYGLCQDCPYVECSVHSTGGT